MNCSFVYIKLLFILCGLVLFVHGKEAKQKRKFTSVANNTFNDRPIFESDLQKYSNWSSWTRCDRCWQHRQKQCLNSKCREFRIFEERPCEKKRCKRQMKRKNHSQLHIVHLGSDKSLSTRNAKGQIWGSWSEWTLCNSECRTFRYRVCKKPGRCRKKRQRQSAYCYHEQTKCEHVVINLITSKIDRGDPNRYRYTYQEPQKPKCGRPNRKSKMLKIIGGRESKKHKWPWHVAVINKYMEVFCAGTLIHPKWVLTAAHCVRNFLKVRLNEFDLKAKDGRELEMIVAKMHIHPRFNQQTVDNDIALLRLPKSVDSPIACMPKSPPENNQQCWIMGWGKTKASNYYGSSTLIEAKIPIVNTSLCMRAYKHYYLSNNMFCSGWMDGHSDTCAGDSGGGLMCPGRTGKFPPFTVQGITSFGDGCGRRNKYGIYTKVFNYLKWIEYIIDNYS